MSHNMRTLMVKKSRRDLYYEKKSMEVQYPSSLFMCGLLKNDGSLSSGSLAGIILLVIYEG